MSAGQKKTDWMPAFQSSPGSSTDDKDLQVSPRLQLSVGSGAATERRVVNRVISQSGKSSRVLEVCRGWT